MSEVGKKIHILLQMPPLCLQSAPLALAERANIDAKRANVMCGYLAQFAIAVA
ncbi:hypothetical protein [Dickeya zeae]|uniref:hypothetical protein n=1 Tax=Dickeya zeae TaxID=204042 RepID=UPI001C632D35|nr:hypothetical protein [Dickeya zeae]